MFYNLPVFIQVWDDQSNKSFQCDFFAKFKYGGQQKETLYIAVKQIYYINNILACNICKSDFVNSCLSNLTLKQKRINKIYAHNLMICRNCLHIYTMYTLYHKYFSKFNCY